MTLRVVLSAPSVDRGLNQSSLFELSHDRVKGYDSSLDALLRTVKSNRRDL